MSDVETAARLVGFGMRPKALPGRDPDVWAETLEALLDDEDRYAAAVRAAREFAASRTWEATAEALASQYTRLVEERA